MGNLWFIISTAVMHQDSKVTSDFILRISFYRLFGSTAM